MYYNSITRSLHNFYFVHHGSRPVPEILERNVTAVERLIGRRKGWNGVASVGTSAPAAMSRQHSDERPSPKDMSSLPPPTTTDQLFHRPIVGRTLPAPLNSKVGVPQASAAVHKKFRKV